VLYTGTMGTNSNWTWFCRPSHIYQEVFNLVFHLRQPASEVMSWSSGFRREMWKMTIEQYKLQQS
jgi:hypothetical protein